MPPITATSHRKQPCNGCRSRKKRCDTARPACSNCRKWGISCDYTNRAYAAERTFGFDAPHGNSDPSGLYRTWNWNVEPPANDLAADSFPPVTDVPWQIDPTSIQNALTTPDVLPGLDIQTHVNMSPDPPFITPESAPGVADLIGVDFDGPLDRSVELQASEGDKNPNAQTHRPSISDNVEHVKIDLPPGPLLMELVNTYFAQHHIFLPFLHQNRFLQKVDCFKHDCPDREESALLYAVIAIAAVSHLDPSVRERRLEWFARAKQLCENTEKRYPSLQAIQASLCICILAWTTGDYPLCWLFIGTSWRQAVTLGLNRIDSGQYSVVTGDNLPQRAVDVEERRRTIWTLFLMDRGMAFPAGWPHAIDDRQFMVNLPVDENTFQNADGKTLDLNSKMPFSRNLRKMIMCTSAEGSSTIYQTILKAYVLLGRVTEHVHSLEASSDPEEHLRAFRQLDTELSRFRLSLPRTATALRSSSVNEAIHVFWLNAILGTLVILLHHRPETAACGALQTTPSTADTPVSEVQGIEGFEHCITVAGGISRMIQEVTKISTDVLINPHISSFLYGCGRTLALHYGETKSEEIESAIDMYLLLFDRIGDVYPTLGTKFRNGMRFISVQDAETIRKIKADGARGMLSKCYSWSGPDPQATLQNLTAAFSQ